MPNLAMRRPGTQFSGDGIDLSWPLGGEREVISVPDDDIPLRVRRRIAEGSIVITSDQSTEKPDPDARVYRLLTGDDAREHMAIPAGPVTRIVYRPSVPAHERDRQAVIQEATESDKFRAGAEQRAAEAVAAHDAIVERQVAAEREAGSKSKSASAERSIDPLAERLNRNKEHADSWLAARDAAFMVREKARQVEAGEVAVNGDAEGPVADHERTPEVAHDEADRTAPPKPQKLAPSSPAASKTHSGPPAAKPRSHSKRPSAETKSDVKKA